jgi:hypothetical protein
VTLESQPLGGVRNIRAHSPRYGGGPKTQKPRDQARGFSILSSPSDQYFL